ncbi:NAD-dependent epimerase/dehydratase family protein [Nucisporomicrobium flavum]|uniref:NAD-dependent epimerase/dehydratase family protein n=1 Tax=Nucisporomicrobium flavum TaxID=2785915 RepID=UPI0018F3D484|nr:NAD-dependent epimerase/dehydratase family protein [Nucisporomicrobium flavum]
MRVLVTGGTGFVGSHTVAALVGGGHEVRLLVRSPDRIAPALRPVGIAEPVDHVVGDVTDRGCVERALDGCDAVLHAAAVYSLDSRAYAKIKETNVRGAETVLTAAVQHGCDPVVHVSSFVALIQRGATVTAGSPLSTARGVYVRSKAESEAVARRLQDDGAPIVIVYPGGVLGPYDPHLGDQVQRLRNVVRGRYPSWPSGGYHQVDVRDVAKLHAAVMTPGAGPRRYVVPGHHVTGETMFTTLRAVTGRRLPHVISPARMMLPFTAMATAAQRVLPVHLPAEYEGVLLHAYDTRFDDSPAREELGVHPRPLVDTYRDTVRWLYDTGRLTARQAGAVH